MNLNLRTITQAEFNNYFDKKNKFWRLKENTIFENIDFNECNCYLENYYVISEVYFKNCVNIPIVSVGNSGYNKYNENWRMLDKSKHLFIVKK